ncbi:MAG: heterodisulfide reductase-related iron-sulfur binding cluster [Chloroflexota bacterium]
MQHTIPVMQLQTQIGPQVAAMAGAIETCVHCGFCLPVCPTYQVLGEEMNSPRGRIVLMKSVLEGELTFQEAAPYIDLCLGCLACVTACPSGVQYGDLVTYYQAQAQEQLERPLMERVQHTLVNATLPYPNRFRSAARLGRLARPLRDALPVELRSMLDLLPARLPATRSLPVRVPAEGKPRARVALLVGCVQQVLDPEINWATLRVLAKNGVEVLLPPGQGCCGAILMHTGEMEAARQLARQNLRAFSQEVDAVLTNAAGCGSGMKSYGLLFQGLEEEEQALAFAARVQDITQFLDSLGLLPPPALPQPLRVAYHDACHLAHAQGVSLPPRQLLVAIPNLTLVEIADGGMCCGSAGTYNLEQPELAAELGRRKTRNILDSGGEAVVTGNIGCMVQIRTQLQAAGKLLPVFHTLELLDMAYSQAR